MVSPAPLHAACAMWAPASRVVFWRTRLRPWYAFVAFGVWMRAHAAGLLLLVYCCVTCVRLPAVSSQRVPVAGRSRVERGCITNGGGEYVVEMVFDDRLDGGVATSLKLVLDTSSANLQVMSDKCPTCRTLTSRQYRGPVREPSFVVSNIYGTVLQHATAAVRLGELHADDVEISVIMSVSPRFFQGAVRMGDRCFDAYQGLLGLGLPSMARGGVASPMLQFTERGAGNGFAVQFCPWVRTPAAPPGTPDHVGHFWIGGWDSHYLASPPVWEPLATCSDLVTGQLTTCSVHRAWTAHGYGLELASISLGARPPVQMPVNMNARLENASDPTTASPFYAAVMPEGSQLWLNADDNVDALVDALANSGYVNFPAGTSGGEQSAFWRGERAIPGATLTLAASAGLVLTFAHGATVAIDAHGLFATIPNEGLKQVGFSGSQGYTQSLVGLSAFIGNVVLFDHEERRIGFAQGRYCQDDPSPGDPGYTKPDNFFGKHAAVTSPPHDNSRLPEGGTSAHVVVVVVVSVALATLVRLVMVKTRRASVSTGASRSLLGDAQPEPRAPTESSQSASFHSRG